MTADLDPLLTSDELATWLGVPVGTVKAWRTRGGGPPAIRVGPRAIRYRAAAVTAWLEERTEERTSA
jgi:excisionase family DNA binding protein